MTVRLNDIAPIMEAAHRAAGRAVVRGTESVRNEALRLILNTPKTGRVYRRRGVEHQASAPGEAPASDTGRLVASIRTEYENNNLVGRVVASTNYAAHLEFGTQRMQPRPFLRPAFANRINAIEIDIRVSVARAVTRGVTAGITVGEQP